MKKILHLTFLASFLFLNSCSPTEKAIQPTLTQSETEIAESPPEPTKENPEEIRYAILAPINPVNIWSLFDEKGASYENYAVQGEYYPRLYRLLPPNNDLTPLLADGFPSPITQEGDFFTSTLSLLPDLKWDDGSPLTAEDIAFTINTALKFELGLNWADFYNKEKLHHVKALDEQTLKYYFSSPPSVGDWQYGALIGIFASKTYWEPKVATIKSLLPPAEDNPRVVEYQAELAFFQAEEEDIREHLKKLSAENAYIRGQELLLEENFLQQEVFKNKIEIIQREKRELFSAARAALYALPDANEPHAGQWQFSSQEKDFIENTAATASYFEKAQYTIYERDAALQALLDNEIDFILNPQGLNAEEINQLSDHPDIQLMENRRNDIRFLALNHKRTPLDDVALRRALFCLIDPEFLAIDRLDGHVAPALGWIPPENIGWHSGIIEPPCAGMDADARLATGTRILIKAGYAWEQEPSPNHASSGLMLPSGAVFPSITLFAPREDSSRTNAAFYIEEMANQLGIPLTAEIIPADDLFFAVYGLGDYDLAIVGWSLSLYPDYLCDFFTEGNPYGYSNAAVDTKCAELSGISDIALARQQLFEIEILLWDNLPAIPLFSSKITEAYSNLSLPFESYLGGIAPALYGAPTLFAQER